MPLAGYFSKLVGSELLGFERGGAFSGFVTRFAFLQWSCLAAIKVFDTPIHIEMIAFTRYELLLPNFSNG